MATIETVESHGNTYRVCDGTFYAADTPAAVIDVLHSARLHGWRIRIHTGYTTPKVGPCDTSVPPVGRDWLEESDVEGTVDRRMGPVKVPILLANARSTAGGDILTDCIVKITTTGKSRRTLYQHPAYHTGRITVKRIKRTFSSKSGKQTLTAAVLCDGKEHTAFTTREKARRWIARMGLEEATCQG